MKKKNNRLVYIVLCILVFVVVWWRILFSSFDYTDTVVISKWDTISSFYTHLGILDSFKIRMYIRRHSDALSPLQPGSYSFSGSYTPSSFLSTISQWPQKRYEKITILEWWSMYDIDAYLTKKKYIEKWTYISAVSDINRITTLSKNYDFVKKFIESKPSGANKFPLTLEGLLYPDTYHISPDQPIVDQLILLQLRAFRDKVVSPYGDKIDNFSVTLRNAWYDFKLGWYNSITLASIIEKEERNSNNKPTIAGVFLNRIQKDMRIDADITLCYGLFVGYESCTPKVILEHLYDVTNMYNTRVHTWLTPSPISNPSVTTIISLLNFVITDYLFYLHDAKGQIWYASDIQWHNLNKSKYL